VIKRREHFFVQNGKAGLMINFLSDVSVEWFEVKIASIETLDCKVIIPNDKKVYFVAAAKSDDGFRFF
jgi:hypothetical protein